MVYLNNIVVTLIFFTLCFASKLIAGEVINDDGATEKEKQELGRYLFLTLDCQKVVIEVVPYVMMSIMVGLISLLEHSISTIPSVD